ERVLKEAERIAGEEGYDVTAEVLYGDAADEVTEYADEVGADGIFVGHRGVSGKHSEMVGSVAQDMIRKAEVPVTVVR
ncbi:MAG: universal stress protein, partial [Halobacteria archaeon]|nr:universal stress protein [Halobacteria archaeon]